MCGDQDKWEVDYDGEVGTFFNAIVDEKYFDDERGNPVYLQGEKAIEVEDQSGNFVPLLNYNIDAMKKDQFYADSLKRGIKVKKFTVNKFLKYLLKVEMQNRSRNVTMSKTNKKDLDHLPEMVMWSSIIMIDIPVVKPQN